MAARAAAFMGKRIVEGAVGRGVAWVSELPADAVRALPDTLDGAAFASCTSAARCFSHQLLSEQTQAGLPSSRQNCVRKLCEEPQRWHAAPSNRSTRKG